MTDHNDIMRAIGNLEGKVDGLIRTVVAHDEKQTNRLNDHALRIRTMERKWAWVAGLLAAAGGGIGSLVTYIRTNGPT